MKYQIVTGDVRIDDIVTSLMKEGWELYGYPFVTGEDNGMLGPVYAQAMILRAYNPDPHTQPEKRVEIQTPVLGFCYMVVCAVQDATDEEILEVCNSQNPSGTSLGWVSVIREPATPQSPIPCAKHDDRVHFVVRC